MARRRWFLLGTLAVLLAIAPMAGTARAGSAQPAPPAAHLYIMFLPGLCAYTNSDPYCHGRIDAAARARSTFHTLITELATAHVGYTPLFYSYNPSDAGGYTVSGTHQTVARSVDALERELRAARQRAPSSRFDLVGHSLGGVVAASWAVTNGRQYGFHASRGLLQVVNSIVTFDSPLHGLQNTLSNNLVTRLFGGDVAYSLQPDSETIKEILFFPNQWWRTKGRLHSVANRADIVVPPAESLLGQTRQVNDTACNRDLLFLRSCHGAVLADTVLNRFIACHWITTSDQCNPRPTPTPMPTATQTPVPPTPTITPTIALPPPPAISPTP